MRLTEPVSQLIVGPAEHGVVRCAAHLARAYGGPIFTAETPDQLDPPVSGPAHLHVTDRLFGPTAESSAAAFAALADRLPAGWSVTLHDVPTPDGTSLQHRRSTTYAAVAAGARGVVVNSRHEARRLAAFSDVVAAVIPLTVDPLPPGPVTESDGQVVLLGFVYPGKGHAEALAALPPAGRLLALGQASAGHQDLVTDLQAEAVRCGRTFTITGFVPDAELPGRLRAAAVPVAPNRQVSASGSIATWLAAGRRPLVPSSDYTDELAAAWPGTLIRYVDLGCAIRAAYADPASTWLPPGHPVGPGTADVVAAYRAFWAGLG